jgi:type IV pilus assembly protein PilP
VIRRIVGIALAGCLLAACGNEANGPTTSEYEAAREQKLKTEVAATKANAKPAAKAAAPGDAPIGLDKDFAYDPTNKRDPFRSFVLEEAKRKGGERGPLEQFELGQIQLQAIVWGTDKPRALVTDPQGRGYIVKEGTPIGKNSGQITRIGDNMVVVREIYEDTLGGRTEKDIEMRIRQSQGG